MSNQVPSQIKEITVTSGDGVYGTAGSFGFLAQHIVLTNVTAVAIVVSFDGITQAITVPANWMVLLDHARTGQIYTKDAAGGGNALLVSGRDA